jgi:hypothetical protein
MRDTLALAGRFWTLVYQIYRNTPLAKKQGPLKIFYKFFNTLDKTANSCAQCRMTTKHQLDNVKLYEPHIMRKSMKAEDVVSEEQLISAAAKTAQDILARQGIKDIAFSDEDATDAHTKFEKHALELGPKLKPSDFAVSTPAGALRFKAIVDEYDHKVVEHADQIRMMVTNKLIELFDNKDARIQIKAAELLGKIADVGMFVDKQEITYKQSSVEDLENRLRAKLNLIIEGELVQDEVVPHEKVKEIKFETQNPGVTPLPSTPKITKATLRHIIV